MFKSNFLNLGVAFEFSRDLSNRLLEFLLIPSLTKECDESCCHLLILEMSIHSRAQNPSLAKQLFSNAILGFTLAIERENRATL